MMNRTRPGGNTRGCHMNMKTIALVGIVLIVLGDG